VLGELLEAFGERGLEKGGEELRKLLDPRE
jgi:hypothetical protein